MKRFKLEYTNIFTRRECSRIVKARDEVEAKIWFENHLDNENLLDGVFEVE